MVCKQTTNSLRHVPTHLSDGLKVGAGLLRFPAPFQGGGQLALDLERPVPPSGQSCSFFFQTYRQIHSGFITCPLPCWTPQLSDPAISSAEPSSQTFHDPHVYRAQFRPLLGIWHLHDLLSDLNPHCSPSAPILTLSAGVLSPCSLFIQSGFGL